MRRLLLIVLLTLAGTGPVCAQSAPPAANTLDMQRVFQVVGQFYDLDPALLAAVARVESNGNATAISAKGAEGLMQLMPGTAQRFGVSDPFDPVANVLGAARFLYELRHQALGQAGVEANLPEVLAAYNAGPSAVIKYHGIPPYDETRAYVRRVLWLYLLGEPSPPPTTRAAPKPAITVASMATQTHHRTHNGADAILDQLAQIRAARARRLKMQSAPAP